MVANFVNVEHRCSRSALVYIVNPSDAMGGLGVPNTGLGSTRVLLRPLRVPEFLARVLHGRKWATVGLHSEFMSATSPSDFVVGTGKRDTSKSKPE